MLINGKEIEKGTMVEVIIEAGLFRKKTCSYIGFASKPSRFDRALTRIFSPLSGRCVLLVKMGCPQAENGFEIPIANKLIKEVHILQRNSEV